MGFDEIFDLTDIMYINSTLSYVCTVVAETKTDTTNITNTLTHTNHSRRLVRAAGDGRAKSKWQLATTARGATKLLRATPRAVWALLARLPVDVADSCLSLSPLASLRFGKAKSARPGVRTTATTASVHWSAAHRPVLTCARNGDSSHTPANITDSTRATAVPAGRRNIATASTGRTLQYSYRRHNNSTTEPNL